MKVYFPPTYQNLPSSTPLNDISDDIFNYTDSDFEMLQNSIYHSNSFPQFYPRVADSPILSFETSPNCQTLPTHIGAPHSPYSLCSLPPKDYHNSKPTIASPPPVFGLFLFVRLFHGRVLDKHCYFPPTYTGGLKL